MLEIRFKEFAKKYPTPASHPNGPTSNGDTTWDQDCAAFVYRFGLFVVGATAWSTACKVFGPTAWDVAKASGTRNGDATKAPAGAIHWWRSAVLSGKPGHVAVDLTGGGTRLAMASYAADPELAPALGYQSVAGYSAARPAMKYAGWTTNYGGASYPLTAPTGDSAQPLQGVKLPALIRIPTTEIGFVSDAGELDVIPSMAEVRAIQATGIVPPGDTWVNLPDRKAWDLLLARTKRIRGTSTAPTLADIQTIVPTAAQNGAAAREAIVK